MSCTKLSQTSQTENDRRLKANLCAFHTLKNKKDPINIYHPIDGAYRNKTIPHLTFLSAQDTFRQLYLKFLILE